ncbi:MAG: ATP-binding cassette domain-containing protein [Eubacteriales bacterium]|nr:ATP-binding cassette domain-containing protein [Eubacteriales bacterium]
MLKLIDVEVTLGDEKGKKKVLDNVNLSLDKNKIYVMTGPNGGGKSSIAKAIMGIYKLANGRIMLDDVDITKRGITERAKLGIGYAFQTPARFKGLKVKDMLKIASGNECTKDCMMLYDVGLCAQDYLEREIDATFSGGELKRIEIASILARQPKVAIFDEPEAGIDLWSFQRLTETFSKLHNKSDTTIIIISHQERILRLADEVILVADGKIKEITSQEKILQEIELIDTGCECRNNCIKGGTANVGCAG